MAEATDAVRRLFRAVEAQNLAGLLDCYAEDVEIHEASGLPYGGTYRGLAGAREHALAFGQVWGPYQSASGQGGEPQFVYAGGGTVVVLFRHRARDLRTGLTLDHPEVGVYDVAEGRIVRSRMFHFDPSALTRFLDLHRLCA